VKQVPFFIISDGLRLSVSLKSLLIIPKNFKFIIKAFAPVLSYLLHGYKVKADFAGIVFIERIDFIQIPFAL
jgi:hypothetical protein